MVAPFSLPLLFAIMSVTIYLFWSGVSKIYIPPENTDQSISLTSSRNFPGTPGSSNAAYSREDFGDEGNDDDAAQQDAAADDRYSPLARQRRRRRNKSSKHTT